MNQAIKIKNSDFIISFGTFFDIEIELKNEILNQVKNKKIDFVYMHPIDNFNLKNTYNQFIKYEAGSEEGICALFLENFSKNLDDNTNKFLENIDIGYISAECSAGEEEFIEAKEKYLKAKFPVLIVGDDIKHHEKIENIVKMLALLKKYSSFEFIILDNDLDSKINLCKDFNLCEIEEIKSFNGSLVYKINKDDTNNLVASQTFANISKLKDGDLIKIKTKNKSISKNLKIDLNLTGTIAILYTKNIFNEYKYSQVIIEKEANEQNY